MSCDYPAASKLSSVHTQAVTVMFGEGTRSSRTTWLLIRHSIYTKSKFLCISRPRMIIERRRKKKKPERNTSSLLISLLQSKKSHCIQPPTTVTVLSLMFSVCQCEELLLSRHSSHPLLCIIMHSIITLVTPMSSVPQSLLAFRNYIPSVWRCHTESQSQCWLFSSLPPNPGV